VTASAHGAQAAAPVETPLHRAPAECKVLATLLFIVAVALVPRGPLVWPYAADAAVLAAVAVAARADPRMLAGRVAMEVPFVLFVVLLPFVTAGPEIDVLGVGLSEEGLWTAWGILAKATLAVLATGLLAWTTPAPAILRGAERLGLPRRLVAIAGFALRYLQVVLDEFRRMQLARVARGDDPRWLWQARAATRTVGALGVRTLARGERVHTAMLARGYDGSMPAVGLAARAGAGAWALALAAPAAALAVLVTAWGWA
jgi:cobalt/nickel transport system permease protein